MSRKSSDFRQILLYINKGEEGGNRAILHNLKTDSDDLISITEEFEDNASYIPFRKNGVIFYHEILSLPEKKSGVFLGKVLEDLAREYLERRAPHALAYAKAHLDTDHPHIHFCISANNVRQRSKNRLSRAEFEGIKRGVRGYGRQKYPELSVGSREKSPLPPLSRGSYGKKMGRGEGVKLMLSEKIRDFFRLERSLSGVFVLLERSGIKPYKRGKYDFYGVIYEGKKYRLSTLGVRELVDDRVRCWEMVKGRLSDLEKIGEMRGRVIEKDRDRC